MHERETAQQATHEKDLTPLQERVKEERSKCEKLDELHVTRNAMASLKQQEEIKELK